MGYHGEIINLKFISCGGVGSLDLDRRPWLDRPWSDEPRDERLGPRPCSSPLTNREWAVLLSLFTVRGRLRKSRKLSYQTMYMNAESKALNYVQRLHEKLSGQF